MPALPRLDTPTRLLAAVLLALVVCATLAAPGGDRPADSAAPPGPGNGSARAAAAALVDRGRYLVTAGNCATCHTAEGGGFMAGGVLFETGFGGLYSTNITPDSATGIGSWSREDFRRAMRHGRRPDGTPLYPAFPYTAYTRLTDTDIDAIWAYLQRVPALRSEPPANRMDFPFNVRPLLALWQWLFLDPGPRPPDPARGARWNRGAYLVEALAHCSACHTPRNRLGAERRDAYLGGGEYLDRVPGGRHRPWHAPNLTASRRGLGLWSQEDLERYLKTGRNAFLEAFGPMNHVVMNSTRYLDDADIGAMASYLKAAPAQPEAAGAAVDARTRGRGRTLYNLHCGTCHLPAGDGDPEMAPRLDAGSLLVQADNPASLINVILHGPETAGAGVAPRWHKPMRGFGDRLDDEEVAAVASFLRASWRNSAGAVEPAQVARQR